MSHNGVGTVLLVEDSLGDVRMTREALRDVNKSIRLHVASDGQEAMAFLRHEAAYVHSPRPEIILLDLNLPQMDGREVLARIKGDPSLSTIPTVILTASDADSDIVKCYQLQANCYFSKPANWDEFDRLVKTIHDYWLIDAKLPR
jgi:CheY-like chemotaxis protein